MTSNNSLYFLGAAVVGIVSAAGIFIAEHFRQERRRHAMAQDLARLDQQLCGMRKELEQLRQLQKEKTAQRLKKNKRQNSRPLPSVSSASDDYNSALEVDSSDLEFYDLSEDEDTTATTTTITALDQTLSEIDKKLNGSNVDVIKDTLNKLTDLCLDFPENPELLWRIGKAHHKIGSASTDNLIKQEHTERGLSACGSALRLNPHAAEAHKWYAILVGSRGHMQAIKEKISDGYLFKEHLDEALKLNPDDATLHHLLGRFAFETASLKWYERKVAATFFAEPPSATYDEALEYSLNAEKLTKTDWKENTLLVAKCQIALGRYQEGVKSLEEAEKMHNDGCLDVTIDSEIKTLLQQYNSYR